MNKKTMTLEQYNKKYRNRTEYLIKLKKSEADAYNKKFEHVVGNQYLFNGRKWQLIGDTYYQIPRPISYTWFRNLHAGVQVATCALLGAIVVGGAATPLILNYINSNLFIVDSKEVIFSYSKDKAGNINANIKTKDNTYEIKSIVLKTDDYEFVKDQDYTYDFDSGNIYIKADVLKEHSGKIHVVPAVTAVQLVGIDCERTLVLDYNGQRSPSDLHVKYYPENAHVKKINDYDLDDNAPFYIDLNDGNKLKAKDGASGTAKLTLYANDGNATLQTECYVTVKEEEEKPEDYLTFVEIKEGEIGTGKCVVCLKQGASYPTNLIVPETWPSKGFPVTQFDTDLTYIDHGIETITLPQNLLQINPTAFMNWTSLKAINFNGTSNLTTIAAGAFTNCTNLEWFKISSKLETVTASVFNGCSKLTFYLDGESKVFSISDDKTMLFDKNKTLLYSMPQAKGDIDLTGYKSLTQLYSGLFNANTNLTGIKLPKSLTSIKSRAFLSSGLSTAVFEDTTHTWSIKNGETVIEPSINVNDPTTNAVNLTKSDWKDYEWVRNA